MITIKQKREKQEKGYYTWLTTVSDGKLEISMETVNKDTPFIFQEFKNKLIEIYGNNKFKKIMKRYNFNNNLENFIKNERKFVKKLITKYF